MWMIVWICLWLSYSLLLCFKSATSMIQLVWYQSLWILILCTAIILDSLVIMWCLQITVFCICFFSSPVGGRTVPLDKDYLQLCTKSVKHFPLKAPCCMQVHFVGYGLYCIIMWWIQAAQGLKPSCYVILSSCSMCIDAYVSAIGARSQASLPCIWTSIYISLASPVVTVNALGK